MATILNVEYFNSLPPTPPPSAEDGTQSPCDPSPIPAGAPVMFENYPVSVTAVWDLSSGSISATIEIPGGTYEGDDKDEVNALAYSVAESEAWDEVIDNSPVLLADGQPLEFPDKQLLIYE